MKFSPRKKNSGFAVIVALVSVTVLTILAGAFAYAMKIETRLAANANHDEQMLWLGRSGVELARYVLAIENNQPFDALNQIWAGGPGAGPETNSPLAGISLTDYPMGEGTVSLKITDLERKVNVNAAPPPLIEQTLTAMGVDAGNISVVSDSIADWIDPDDATKPGGAESDYYQGMNPPYYAKNAPIDDISELLRIKGVTPGMFDGTGQEDDTGAPFQHHQMGLGHTFSQEPHYAFYLTNVFTPFGSGKININTADQNALLLLGLDTASVESILKFRAGGDGVDGTEDDMPFQNPGMLTAAGISQEAAQKVAQYITTKSTTFEVHVTARIHDLSREYVAIIWRNGASAQTVGFYWK